MYVAALALELSQAGRVETPILLPFTECSLFLEAALPTDSNGQCIKVPPSIAKRLAQFAIVQCVHSVWVNQMYVVGRWTLRNSEHFSVIVCISV